jgi:hypothetical protein
VDGVVELSIAPRVEPMALRGPLEASMGAVPL